MGGWETLNIWLQDAKAVSNNEFIGELLDVYQNVPVSIELLKQNNCAKTIKQLSKAAAAKGDDSKSGERTVFVSPSGGSILD